MQYLIYFAVTVPLLFGWLFWQASTMPPAPPLFASGYASAPQPPQKSASVSVTSPGAKKKLARTEGSSTD